MNPALGILLCVGFIVLVVLGWGIAIYNRLVKLRLHIRESWSDIDVELVRRYELIPNLVATVKGYAKHERETLERVVELRNKAAANRGAYDSQASDESSLMLGVKQLFAVAEAYPQLKADVHFLELQRELALTEDRIAASRRFFNANVRDYNAMCQSVPTNIVAGMFGHEPQTYFEIRDEAQRVVPRVELDP
ncbi:MAG: LemA family protein [Phycisphaeraceae bacterium]|nr:LemA family protein [Phycisphaerales bacterium]MCB9859161.1 LemA family protein [Phycisphaeraceae bacterium]